MPKKVLINSKTSGKFKRELIDGRSHIVTTMMPIRGDISMNRKFYPDDQVSNSFMQLNLLPAPNGHPTVNGIAVPAFHPVANNKHNIGGFLRNPRKKGKRVFVDFMLDEEVANNSDSGKETIRRIEAGEKIGVSTGLTINQVTNETGSDDFGVAYNAKVAGFNFDHVAILLNEEAAGKHAGTELVLNEAGEEIEVIHIKGALSLNELSLDDIYSAISGLIRTNFPQDAFVFVMDVFPESRTFIFQVEEVNAPPKMFKQSFALDLHGEVEILGDRIEVIRITEFIPKETLTNQDEVSEMDKLSIVLAIIGNSANKYTVADKDSLMAKSDDELTSLIATNTVDKDGAKEMLTNAGFDFKGYENFMANKDKFDTYLASQEDKLKELKTNIVANSDYTAEMLAGKSEDELNVLNSLAKPSKIAARAAEGGSAHIQTNAGDLDPVVNYS